MLQLNPLVNRLPRWLWTLSTNQLCIPLSSLLRQLLSLNKKTRYTVHNSVTQSAILLDIPCYTNTASYKNIHLLHFKSLLVHYIYPIRSALHYWLDVTAVLCSCCTVSPLCCEFVNPDLFFAVNTVFSGPRSRDVFPRQTSIRLGLYTICSYVGLTI